MSTRAIRDRQASERVTSSAACREGAGEEPTEARGGVKKEKTRALRQPPEKEEMAEGPLVVAAALRLKGARGEPLWERSPQDDDANKTQTYGVLREVCTRGIVMGRRNIR